MQPARKPPDSAYLLAGPTGRTLAIPTGPDPRGDACPPWTDGAGFRAHLESEGFALARGLVPGALCDAVAPAYAREVKPDRGYFLRHASGRPEPHRFTEHGHMLYPIMNLQDLPRARFTGFRGHGLTALAHDHVKGLMAALLGEPGRIIHTMFFDGNQETWAHQDACYIDAEQPGAMLGLWVALEDIHPGAGRFYVCPGSHRLPLPGRELDPNREAYKAHVREVMNSRDLEVYAPALRKGDALVWSGLTIHGSLGAPEPWHSRKSLTCHYIPASQGFVWFQGRRPAQAPVCVVNGVSISQHYDLEAARHRVAYAVRGRWHAWARRLLRQA